VELGQHGAEVTDLRTFAEIRRRRLRRDRAQRFYVQHIGNVASWRPFCGIEDLGSKVPGALLFEGRNGVSDYTWIASGPPLGS
jgi:hypothetical protein